MMKKYFLLALSAILLVTILLAIPGKNSFVLDGNEIIEKIHANEYIISVDQLKTLQENENTVILDLNPSFDSQESSLPGAIKLPLENLSIKLIRQTFAGPGPYIIYSREILSSCNTWILLTQMGYENIFVLNLN